jgi:hypothetical protein
LNILFLLALSISLTAIFSLGLVDATTKDKDDEKDDDEDDSGDNEHDESGDADDNGESETIDSSTFFGDSNDLNSEKGINTNEDTSDIMMESILKSGTVFKSNLYISESDTKFTFSNGNELCPSNDCEYKFLEGELNRAIFGGKEDKRLKGTLQIEDKANSDVNFKAYNLYKVSGDLKLQTIKENSKTGEKIHVYEGELNIDKDDTIFNPEFKYQIQGKYSTLTKKFELDGEINN